MRREGCFAFQSSLPEPFAFRVPAPQTRRGMYPLLSRLILSVYTDGIGSLWGTWVTLRNETILKVRRELQQFQTLFRAKPFFYCAVRRVGMGLPRLPGAKSGEKREVAPFFLSAYKPQVFLLPFCASPSQCCLLKVRFQWCLKQELPGV